MILVLPCDYMINCFLLVLKTKSIRLHNIRCYIPATPHPPRTKNVEGFAPSPISERVNF